MNTHSKNPKIKGASRARIRINMVLFYRIRFFDETSEQQRLWHFLIVCKHMEVG